MSYDLREELASLRIERGGFDNGVGVKQESRRRRIGFGWLLTLMLWVVPTSILGMAGVYGYREYEKYRPKHEVSITTVQKMTTGEAEKLLSAKGYILSQHQAKIGAKSAGRIEKLNVEEGTPVKKGDILAVLEHNDMKAMLESRHAMMERTSAELTEANSDLAEKERKYKRNATLYGQRNIPVNDLETAMADRDKANSRVRALEAGVKLMQANIAEVEENIRNMHIIAPFDGTILDKQAQEGETIIPGGMGGQSGRGAVATLANLKTLDVETDVNETYLSRIKIGQPAEISVSAVPDRRYRGKLRKIVPLGDRARGTIKVLVQIEDPDDRLFPELVATVHFLPDRERKVDESKDAGLFVSKRCVFEEGGHSYVWVVDSKTETLEKRRVEVVVTEDDLARVESGLSTGESIVDKPDSTLRDKEKVSIAR